MPVKEIGDPRLQALFGASEPREGGVRPTVRLPRKGLPPIVMAAAMLLVAVLLFSLLNWRRTARTEPTVQSRASDQGGSAWTTPPPLYIPPITEPVSLPPAPELQPEPKPLITPVPSPAIRAAPAPTPLPVPQFMRTPMPAPMSHPPERTSSSSPLVIDTSGSPSAASSPMGGSALAGSSPAQAPLRIRAGVLANRSTTVPQGYLIPAVLETGFDSTRSGFARAIVSRDVRGFDGKNVLIPRGSRLIGEYQTTTAKGQNRAVITWTRLIRPDGMTIMIDSPAVDTVGRGGVPASVNTHFLARFGDALLQSTFAIGQAFAGRAVTGPVVVLPGQVGSAASQLVTPGTNYVPTLKVAPGKSLSVFVAHDLDFSSALGAQ
jgi:type IV secretion system protein VirB10